MPPRRVVYASPVVEAGPKVGDLLLFAIHAMLHSARDRNMSLLERPLKAPTRVIVFGDEGQSPSLYFSDEGVSRRYPV